MQKFLKRAAMAALSVGSVASFAAGTAPDTSAITDAATNVGTIGTAVFAVYVAVKGFKWIRAAL